MAHVQCTDVQACPTEFLDVTSLTRAATVVASLEKKPASQMLNRPRVRAVRKRTIR